MDHRYVQFGCGMCAPETWQNFDAGPAFWLQSRLPFLTPLLVKKGFPPYPKNIEYGDVIKGLPIGDSSENAAAADDASDNGEDTGAAFVADETEFNIFNTDLKLAALEQVVRQLSTLDRKSVV